MSNSFNASKLVLKQLETLFCFLRFGVRPLNFTDKHTAALAFCLVMLFFITISFPDEILVELRALPSPMQPTDLSALVDITRVYIRKTPTSFYTHYLPFLFGTPTPGSDDGNHLVDGALALLVSVEEVLSVAQTSTSRQRPLRPFEDNEDEVDVEEEGVRFLLVDCRPADQYNAGHLATAFYLDTELMLSNPPEFSTSVQVSCFVNLYLI